MGSIWSVRRARATHLLDRTPHASEILTFYAGLTEAQERVAAQVPAAEWLALIRSPESDSPWLRVDTLPLDGLALPFREFLSRVADLGTEQIREGARTLLSGDDDGRIDPLRNALSSWREPELGRGPNPEGEEIEEVEEVESLFGFYARAFLDPVITSIAQATSTHDIASTPETASTPEAATAQTSALPNDWTRNSCYVCGGQPQVAVLRDLSESIGHRSLTCSMCATEWRFQRLTCPHCGETEAGKLPVHTAESIAHVRVDACTTCSRYIKTVDLRKQGNAVPLVDEMAAVELDLWAQEQGLTKVRTNVLGL